MAVEILLSKDNMVKESVVGFSWTTLFFGCFVPLFRGDWVWFFVLLILSFITGGLAQIVMAFIYNKIYTRKLLENGWKPANEYTRNVLICRNLIIE